MRKSLTTWSTQISKNVGPSFGRSAGFEANFFKRGSKQTIDARNFQSDFPSTKMKPEIRSGRNYREIGPGQSCLRQPSRKFGTHLSKPVVSSRRDAIFLARPELPRKIWPWNILGQILTKDRQNYIKSCQLGMTFFQAACLYGKKENGLFPKHMACIFQWCFANQKILGGVFKYGLPDMAFQT